MRTSDDPPPGPPDAGAKPPDAPPVSTSTYKVAVSGGTATVVVTVAPAPPVPPGSPSPPRAPVAVTVRVVTPSGTLKVSSPWAVYVHVAVAPFWANTPAVPQGPGSAVALGATRVRTPTTRATTRPEWPIART